MVIQIDTREKPKAIEGIISYFDENNISHIRSKLYVGDYQNIANPLIVVDRKQNLAEVASNLGKDKPRLLQELKKAKSAGIKIVFLVEHGNGIRCLQDVYNWYNPRLKESPMAISGKRIVDVFSKFRTYYGCEIEFCDKKDTGQKIIEILKGTE